MPTISQSATCNTEESVNMADHYSLHGLKVLLSLLRWSWFCQSSILAQVCYWMITLDDYVYYAYDYVYDYSIGSTRSEEKARITVVNGVLFPFLFLPT